jgi:hypothetical protein
MVNLGILGLSTPDLRPLLGFWGVPMATTLAYRVGGEVRTPVIDQTLWEITNVHGSYFFGKLYANIGGSWSVKTLNGMVAPNNNVYITLEDPSQNLMTGFGQLYPNRKLRNLKKSGLFIMQMASPLATVNVSTIHSSYMFPISRGDIFYNFLPGTLSLNGGVSYWGVEQFKQLAIENTS